MEKRLPESADWETRNQHPVSSRSPEKQPCVDLEKYCAYNQTRGCLLGSIIDVADFSVASFNHRMHTLTANSSAGVWLIPFRGISNMSEQIPIDLIYLNADSFVIDVVESFPIFRISNASSPAASVLALPRHTINSTQTRRGDQLLICAATEFNRRLLQLPSITCNAGTAQSTVGGGVQSIYSGSGNQPQSKASAGQGRRNMDAPPEEPSSSRKSRVDVWNDRKRETIKPAKNWLLRWWYPELLEPRKAPREEFPGVAAHFWTGGNPVDHGVRDISSTGLYVVTDERWFPGTEVRMTLTDSEEPSVKNSITANTKVVRWGNDGVGLKFVMENEKALRRGQIPLVDGTVDKELNLFLQLARSGKHNRETREAHRMALSLESEKAISGRANPDFDGLFIGPINSSLLIDSLKDLPRPVSVAGTSPMMNLSTTSALQSTDVESSTPSARRPRILLIDDDFLDIMFLAETLEDDYVVIFASDGVTALESAGRNLPDLILLDVMMPGIDGFEVCRRLKADHRTKEIPVIFITGLSEVAAETKALKMGAVDYISKPFHPAQLKVGVNMHVKRRMAPKS